MIEQRSRLLPLAKRAAPSLSRLLSRAPGFAATQAVVTYVDALMGLGSGSGWDDGEIVVPARLLRDNRNPVIVDCGANYGDWTTRLRQELGSSAGTWLLLEPLEAPRRELAKIPNVEIIAAAAGERSDTLTFHTPTTQSGWSSLYTRGDSFSQTEQWTELQVPVVRLEDELEARNIDRVDYLKVDVEGHELFVLKGLGRYLTERAVASLAFEFGAGNVNSRTFFRDMWELLDGAGYQISRIAPGGALVPIRAYYESLEYFRSATNYVAIAVR